MQEKIEWNKIGKWLLTTDEAKVATTIADKKFHEEFDEWWIFSIFEKSMMFGLCCL